MSVEPQGHDRHRVFRAIAIRTEGFLVVGMRDGCRLDHAVMVDVNLGIIVDLEESDVLLLSARSLQRRGVPSTRKLRIQEVRVVERIEMKRAREQEYTQVVDVIDVYALLAPKLLKTNS